MDAALADTLLDAAVRPPTDLHASRAQLAAMGEPALAIGGAPEATDPITLCGNFMTPSRPDALAQILVHVPRSLPC
jgi:hypothetical protein